MESIRCVEAKEKTIFLDTCLSLSDTCCVNVLQMPNTDQRSVEAKKKKNKCCTSAGHRHVSDTATRLILKVFVLHRSP